MQGHPGAQAIWRGLGIGEIHSEGPRGLTRVPGLTTSVVASVDSIGSRADTHSQVGSSNCAGKRSRSDKFARIQELLANKIRSAGATSEGREPLRLVIPPGVPIELWDSGLAISAHAGDKQQTIATTYHVPLWALTQINKLSETVALTESQRIVIPHSIGQKLPSSPAQSPVASDATPTEH